MFGLEVINTKKKEYVSLSFVDGYAISLQIAIINTAQTINTITPGRIERNAHTNIKAK